MKNIAIAALLITALAFLAILGISLVFESGRTEEIRRGMMEIDVLWNDARFFSQYAASATLANGGCEFLAEENRRLGDRIYAEGLKMEKYEDANKLTDSLLTEKKRYALLDLQFWKNSIEIKQKCGSAFSTVIYFYSQYNETADQKLMDRILSDFKQRCGRATVYIAFPADMGLSSIGMIKAYYNITETPSVLINEKTVLQGIADMEELNGYARCW